jgi:hypothetical protein
MVGQKVHERVIQLDFVLSEVEHLFCSGASNLVWF